MVYEIGRTKMFFTDTVYYGMAYSNTQGFCAVSEARDQQFKIYYISKKESNATTNSFLNFIHTS